MRTELTRARVEHSHNSPNRALITENLLTTREVAQRCRVPESTVRYWRMRGEGPCGYKVGRKVVYPDHSVTEWLQERHEREIARRHPNGLKGTRT